MHASSVIMSLFNTLLFVCCLFCIKQYFKPGNNIRLPFHIFNLVFIAVFYSIAIPFLLNNIEYFSAGDRTATPLSILIKFFFGSNISSVQQWIIVGTIVINILYIKKYREDYFNIGIPIEKSKPTPVVEEPLEKEQPQLEA